MDAFIAIAAIILGGLLYFLPALTADRRRHHNRAAILVLNVFLGWTFLGWVIAMIWAITNPSAASRPIPPGTHP